MKIAITKKLTINEIKQIADIHERILDESVLNHFGKKFLSILYQKIIKNKNNIVITLKKNKELVGFLVATTDSKNFYKDIITKGFWKLSYEIIKKTISNRKLFLETLIWSFLKSKKSKQPACLMFIAIDNQYQGAGFGSKMVDFLNKEFKKRNIFQYRVGTKANNKKSNGFYKKLKFVRLKPEFILGEKNNYYLSPVIASDHLGSKASKKR